LRFEIYKLKRRKPDEKVNLERLQVMVGHSSEKNVPVLIAKFRLIFFDGNSVRFFFEIAKILNRFFFHENVNVIFGRNIFAE
jgi:hypothetical protein